MEVLAGDQTRRPVQGDTVVELLELILVPLLSVLVFLDELDGTQGTINLESVVPVGS